MKRLLISGSVVAAVAAMVLVACSELKKDLVSPVLGGFRVHPASWSDTTSPGFHGKVVLADTAKVDEQLQACAKCHPSSYSRATSGVSCYACHADYPHMP